MARGIGTLAAHDGMNGVTIRYNEGILNLEDECLKADVDSPMIECSYSVI